MLGSSSTTSTRLVTTLSAQKRCWARLRPPARAWSRRSPLRCRDRFIRRGRQQDGERAARPGGGLESNLAAVPHDDVANHREADAGALDGRRRRGIAAEELIEDEWLLRGRNARTLVGHANRDPSIALFEVNLDGACV